MPVMVNDAPGRLVDFMTTVLYRRSAAFDLDTTTPSNVNPDASGILTFSPTLFCSKGASAFRDTSMRWGRSRKSAVLLKVPSLVAPIDCAPARAMHTDNSRLSSPVLRIFILD